MYRKTLFHSFSRDQWQNVAQHHANKRLSEQTITDLQSECDPVPRDELAIIYRPIAELLHRCYTSDDRMSAIISETFSNPCDAAPYVVAVTGGVAVGKSTIARALAVLLRQWHQHPEVELVSVDSFIKSQDTLNAQGLAHKKGFLESFDFDFLLSFLTRLKSRDLPLTLPLYSHRLYDRVKNDSQLIKAPDVVVIEGLHLLNPYPLDTQGLHVLSDYVDFSVYVDADVTYIKRWFFERFLHLREQARDDEEAFFHQFAIMEQEQALQIANDVWENMNAPNYWQNIHPYRERADLILSKNVHHEVDKVWLRK